MLYFALLAQLAFAFPVSLSSSPTKETTCLLFTFSPSCGRGVNVWLGESLAVSKANPIQHDSNFHQLMDNCSHVHLIHK